MSFADSVVNDAEFSSWLLRRFERRWEDCTRCRLCERAERVVLGEGSPDPLLLVLAEAPGATEDRTGRPLVGAAGRLFRAVCAKIDLDLSRAYLTNVVACRPPRNRAPELRERMACRARLVEQADLLRPRVLLLMGRTAMRVLSDLPREATVGQHRGLVRGMRPDFGHRAGAWRLKATFVTYHPSHVLRQETRQKKQMALARFVADLRKVQRVVSLLDRKVERLPVMEV